MERYACSQNTYTNSHPAGTHALNCEQVDPWASQIVGAGKCGTVAGKKDPMSTGIIDRLCRSRAVARSGSAMPLKRGAQCESRNDDSEKPEIEGLRVMMTELSAETIEDLRLEDLSRIPAEAKAQLRQISARKSLENQVGTRCRLYEVPPEQRVAICEFAPDFLMC